MRIKGNDLIISTGSGGGGSGGSIYIYKVYMNSWVLNEDGTYSITIPRKSLYKLGSQISCEVYKKNQQGYYQTHNIPGEGYISRFSKTNEYKITVDANGRFEGKLVFSGIGEQADITETSTRVYESIFAADQFIPVGNNKYRFIVYQTEYCQWIGDEVLGVISVYYYDNDLGKMVLVSGYPQPGYKIIIDDDYNVNLEVDGEANRFDGKILLMGYNSVIKSNTAYDIPATLKADSWTDTGDGYVQTVTVPGITSDMKPDISIDFDETDLGASRNMVDEYSKITYIAIGDGEIRAYCLYDVLTTDLTIRLRGGK